MKCAECGDKKRVETGLWMPELRGGKIHTVVSQKPICLPCQKSSWIKAKKEALESAE